MLNELRNEIYQNAVDKGLYKDNPSILESLAHVTSEVGEAIKAVMVGNYCTEDKIDTYTIEPPKEICSVSIDGKQSICMSNPTYNSDRFDPLIKDTFEDEIADSIIRLFSLAGDCGIDLDFHVREKMKFNKTR